MTSRKFSHLAIITILASGLASASLAQAQTTQPQTPSAPPGLGPRAGAAATAGAPAEAAPPNVETVATHNGWIVQCGEVPAQNGQPAGKTCGMTRSGNSEKDAKIGISLIVKRFKGQDGKVQTVMDAFAPIGVYLPTGVAMEIDGTALEGRMAFTRCLPRACDAFGEASEVTLKKFTKGKQVTFYIYDRPGNGYPIKFPLPGFTEGLADLDKNAAK